MPTNKFDNGNRRFGELVYVDAPGASPYTGFVIIAERGPSAYTGWAVPTTAGRLIGATTYPPQNITGSVYEGTQLNGLGGPDAVRMPIVQNLHATYGVSPAGLMLSGSSEYDYTFERTITVDGVSFPSTVKVYKSGSDAASSGAMSVLMSGMINLLTDELDD